MAKAGFLELEHIEGDIFNVHLTKEQVDLVATFSWRYNAVGT